MVSSAQTIAYGLFCSNYRLWSVLLKPSPMVRSTQTIAYGQFYSNHRLWSVLLQPSHMVSSTQTIAYGQFYSNHRLWSVLLKPSHMVSSTQTIAYGQFYSNHRIWSVLAYFVHNKSQKWAVKMIGFDEEMAETEKFRLKLDFNKEVKIMTQLNHPFIASRCVVAECPDYLVICRHFYPHGCLQDQLKSISDDKAECYLAHVGSAVEYIHRKRIAHGDIKLRNIMVNSSDQAVLSDIMVNSSDQAVLSDIMVNSSDQAVLSDFSLAFEVPEGVSEISEFGGTLGYVAPEVFTEPTADPFKVDVYAMGVVLWCMVLNRRPKHNLRYLEVVNKTLLIPHQLKIALHMLLHPDPVQRTDMVSFMDKLTSGRLWQEYEDKLREESTEDMDDMDDMDDDSIEMS